jgi:hypothetical protein
VSQANSHVAEPVAGIVVRRRWNNWTIILVLFALSLLLAAQVMVPKLFA